MDGRTDGRTHAGTNERIDGRTYVTGRNLTRPTNRWTYRGWVRNGTDGRNDLFTALQPRENGPSRIERSESSKLVHDNTTSAEVPSKCVALYKSIPITDPAVDSDIKQLNHRQTVEQVVVRVRSNSEQTSTVSIQTTGQPFRKCS